MIEYHSKILVVDDERINIQLLYEGLSASYSILAASTGIEALKVAKQQLPDLILLDVMLSDMSGYEVCELLKQDAVTKDIPIIFATSKDTTEDELKGLELGAVDYLKKPFVLPLVKARVGIQIELAQKTALLEHLSSVDGLTGVANRRQFDEKLAQAIRYSDRNHRGLTLLLIDIDYFKQFNDTYGHVNGDQALKQVAKVLANGACRPLDFVSRYGGEEFAILLLDSSLDEGADLGEKLCKSVMNLNVQHETSVFKTLTISIGVSHVAADHLAKINGKKFIEDADESLYQAKASGRNNVVASQFIVD